MEIKVDFGNTRKELADGVKAMMENPLMGKMAQLIDVELTDDKIKQNKEKGMAMLNEFSGKEPESLTVNLPDLDKMPEEQKKEAIEAISEQLNVFLAVVSMSAKRCSATQKTDFARKLTEEIRNAVEKNMPSLDIIIAEGMKK